MILQQTSCEIWMYFSSSLNCDTYLWIDLWNSEKCWINLSSELSPSSKVWFMPQQCLLSLALSSVSTWRNLLWTGEDLAPWLELCLWKGREHLIINGKTWYENINKRMYLCIIAYIHNLDTCILYKMAEQHRAMHGAAPLRRAEDRFHL